MRKPKGHVRPHGTGYQVIVPVGRDPVTKRYRYAYRQAATREEAEKLRDELLADLAKGRQPRREATFGQLLDAVLEVADLDVNTRVLYQGEVEETVRPALGDYGVGYLEQHPELLDRLYAALGRCRRLCGGRRGLIDHRTSARGERLTAGTPDHECDERCRPHECRPAEPATVVEVHAIIEGAFGYAVQWKWVRENPALSASPPAVSAEHDPTPDAGEAIRLLAAAQEHSRVMAVITWLALVTGARRGELCALRWRDIDEHEGYLLISGTYAAPDGQRQIKPTRTHRNNRLALDPETLELLAEYKVNCRHGALGAGGALDEDGFIFSSDGLGKTPWHPDTISDWFRQVAKAAGVQATMHALRHYDATQMLSSGIDLRTAAGRPGHNGGGSVTLRVYAHRTRPTDQRAAELLAEQLQGVNKGGTKPGGRR
jgi:integrase